MLFCSTNRRLIPPGLKIRDGVSISHRFLALNVCWSRDTKSRVIVWKNSVRPLLFSFLVLSDFFPPFVSLFKDSIQRLDFYPSKHLWTDVSAIRTHVQGCGNLGSSFPPRVIRLVVTYLRARCWNFSLLELRDEFIHPPIAPIAPIAKKRLRASKTNKNRNRKMASGVPRLRVPSIICSGFSLRLFARAKEQFSSDVEHTDP